MKVSVFLYITIFSLLLASCSSGLTPGTSVGTATSTASVAPKAGENITLVPAVSDIGVGRNRFAFGILDSNNTPILNASVKVKFYQAGAPSNVQEAKATFHGEGFADRGVYAVYGEFSAAGVWALDVEVEIPGKGTLKGGVNFMVAPKSITPAIGEPVPLSRSKSIKDASNLEEITSDRPPDPDLYQLTVADAVADRKPFLVVFATPAFCTSQTCGPEVVIVKQLQKKIGDRMNFIHVEIYDKPAELLKGSRDFRVSRTVDEWRLPSEPWIFLVDAQGKVAAKFEGPTSIDEIEGAIQQLSE